MMPEGKEIGKVLLDSEYYINEVIEEFNEKGVKWLIAVDKDSAVKKAIEAIGEGVYREPHKRAQGLSACGHAQAERMYLKIAATVEKYKIYLEMRERLYQLSSG